MRSTSGTAALAFFLGAVGCSNSGPLPVTEAQILEAANVCWDPATADASCVRSCVTQVQAASDLATRYFATEAAAHFLAIFLSAAFVALLVVWWSRRNHDASDLERLGRSRFAVFLLATVIVVPSLFLAGFHELAIRAKGADLRGADLILRTLQLRELDIEPPSGASDGTHPVVTCLSEFHLHRDSSDPSVVNALATYTGFATSFRTFTPVQQDEVDPQRYDVRQRFADMSLVLTSRNNRPLTLPTGEPPPSPPESIPLLLRESPALGNVARSARFEYLAGWEDWQFLAAWFVSALAAWIITILVSRVLAKIDQRRREAADS